jgi:glycosidase
LCIEADAFYNSGVSQPYTLSRKKTPRVTDPHYRSLWHALPGLIVIALCTTAWADEPVIRLAGTFNNWSTQDDDYRMAKAGERYELVGSWEPGTHEFKFVFDGSWDRHLGAAEDGKLVQPGVNIQLNIPEPGGYAVVYDPRQFRWAVEPRSLDTDAAKRSLGRKALTNLQEIEMDPHFKTPDWAKRAVWYQIFPERFRNGDATNDPPRTVPWTHQWYEPYKAEKSRRQRVKTSKHPGGDSSESGDFWSYIFDRRYGGDLQGVREKLPYLRELGINAIYFNPIFQAESLHKYDASDYRHVDDFFAVKNSLAKIKGETADPKTWKWSESDMLFLDFLKEAHTQGFRVILDGVFNHVGRDFWAFKDVLKHKDKSPYAAWFDIKSFKPFHYKAWDKDDGTLPRLAHDEALGLAEPVREHIFAVTRRWMDPNGDGDPTDGIDGWRLDVAGDINANFWKDWRKLVKSINPDAYIVAELWEESRPWLNGQTFDAVMNYPFARACQRFFVDKKMAIKPSEFEKRLREILGWYPPQVNYVLQNLFDSHDTDRIASMFMNPDLQYDQANRQQDNGPKYNVKRPTKECYEKLKLMVTFQMTGLGAPMLYYGDEVGMFGADDPSCRKPMLWKDLMPYDDPDERIEPGLFEHYQRTIAIRNTYPPLQLGSFEPLLSRDDQGVFAFSRSLNDQQVVVVLNNSDHTHRLNVPVSWPDGSRVVRLDDPKACGVLPPADARSRPTVRSYDAALKVEGGRLHGCMIHPRTAGIFTKA